MFKSLGLLLVLLAAVFGAYKYWWLPHQNPASQLDDAVAVVTGFGTALQMVPLAGDPDVARAAIAEHYKPYVTRELLAEWEEDPQHAPGRQTSSPWPQRIEAQTATVMSADYLIKGDIVYITSEELVNGGDAGRDPFAATVVKQDGQWRISEFQVIK